MDSIGIIIQARTGSTRLPAKMIMPFFNGHSVLEILLQRLRTEYADTKIIVATTTLAQDDQIANITQQQQCIIARGDEQDVLQRFIDTARANHLKKVIRICADNPFLDIPFLNILMMEFLKRDCDYLSYCTSNGTPSIKTHYGFWAEAVKTEALIRVCNSTSESIYHEHVTNYIYTHPDYFNVEFIPISNHIEQKSDIRLTLDTIEDFTLQQQIYRMVLEKKQNFSSDDVLDILELHPDYLRVMRQQIQNNSK